MPTIDPTDNTPKPDLHEMQREYSQRSHEKQKKLDFYPDLPEDKELKSKIRDIGTKDPKDSQFWSSMVKATAELRSVSMDSINPHFKSRYASLESVIKTIKPIIAKYDLGFSQAPLEGFKLETTIFHKSGSKTCSIMQMKPQKDTPQGIGSNLTYMKRYALCSLFGLAGDEDDDGNKASAPEAPVASDTAMIWDKIKKLCVQKGKTKADIEAAIYKMFGKTTNLSINDLNKVVKMLEVL